MTIHFEDILDEIRIQIGEEIQGMTSEEVADFYNRRAEKVAKEFGFQIVITPILPPSTRPKRVQPTDAIARPPRA